MKTKEIQQKFRNNISKLLNCREEQIEIGIYENSSGAQYTLEEFFNHYNPEEIGKGQCSLVFKVNKDKQTVITFQLKDMYNCCGIIVGSDLTVSKNFRHIGLGDLSTRFMIDFSNYYGYGMLQGADRKDNEYQIRIFEKQGWKKGSEFYNPKTGNNLIIWFFNLDQYENK